MPEREIVYEVSGVAPPTFDPLGDQKRADRAERRAWLKRRREEKARKEVVKKEAQEQPKKVKKEDADDDVQYLGTVYRGK